MSLLLTAVVLGPLVLHGEPERRAFDVAPGEAAQSLKAFSIQAGQDVLFSTETVVSVQTQAVRGRYTPGDALSLLLARTPLSAVQDERSGAWRIRRNDSNAAGRDQPPQRSTDKPGAGAILGRVNNKATGSYLEGAQVELQPSGQRTFTDAQGFYSLANVSPGEHAVVVSYAGLTEVRATVQVPGGGTVRHDVELSAEVYQLETFVVVGEREGNAASITRQKVADNAMNVVAMDAFGNVADGNIGNFMQRLPGVGVMIENGDVIGFGVRGAPAEFNAVNVDGVALASPHPGTSPQGDRATVIDMIPSEFIKEVELVKALTPDLPADSIGGSTNLVTKSALDVKGRRLTFRSGLNSNLYRRDERSVNPTAAFSCLTRIGAEETLGLALSGTCTQTSNTRDRMQTTRNQPDGRVTGARTLDDQAIRLRSGFGMKLNYRPSPALDLQGSYQYSYYSFNQNRTDWQINAPSALVANYADRSRSNIEAGQSARTRDEAGNLVAAGVAPGFTDSFTEILHATFLNTTGVTARHSRNHKFALGGKLRLPAEQSLNFQASYNPADYTFLFQTVQATKSGGLGLAVDSADPNRPRFVQTYGPSIGFGGPMDGYKATRTVNDQRGEQTVLNASVDYEKRFSVRAIPLQFKSGANWRRQDHQVDMYQPEWNYVGPDGVAGSVDDRLEQFVSAAPGYGIFNGLYESRNHLDYALVDAAFGQHGDWFREKGTTVSSPATHNAVVEDVYAFYGMGRAQLGRLGLLGGVRMETTEIEAVGRGLRDAANPALAGTGSSRSGDYVDLFPSLHCRFELWHDLLLRASYSTGSARPDFDQLYPRAVVTYNDDAAGTAAPGRVTRNDPSLRPQYSRNYDLSVEYYFEPVGVLSAGVFHKSISNFISKATQTIGTGPDNGFGGLYEGFDLITNRNFGAATIRGLELNYSQQLRRLPRPLNTLSVFANYTRIRTKGNYDEDTDELVRFIPETANAGLSWRYDRFELRAAYNFRSGYLVSYNVNRHQRQRMTSVDTWDFTAQVRVARQLTVFLDIVNAGNKWASQYSGDDRSRITMSEVYGTRMTVGLSGQF